MVNHPNRNKGKIRVIVASTNNGEKEEVVFTEYFDTPALDFVSRGLTVDKDEVIYNNLPMGFPTDYRLVRS